MPKKATKKTANKTTTADAPVEETLEVKEEAPVEETSKDETKSEAQVLDQHGNLHRTYSLDIHGKDYKKLAEQFVSSRPGWKVR